MNNDAGFIHGAKRSVWLRALISTSRAQAATEENPPVVVERNGVLSVQPAPEQADFPATPGLDVVAEYGRIGK